jgi:death-on-curing protein
LNTTFFPTLEEALYLHQILIDSFGGQHGVRDKGLLESALARPKSGYYEALSLQAAALLHSLTLNHCFLDGNKRLAFALTATFLKMNGFALKVNADEAEEFIINQIIKNKEDATSIATWIEGHLEKTKKPK